jgi:hypothetical protein
MHQARHEEKVMQTQEKVVIDDRALIGWHMTPASDRAKVMEALERLVGRPPEDYPAGAVERWWPDRDLFAYHYPSPEGELLIFFYPRDGRLHIDSLAPKERYDPFRVKPA